jgi:hypothetical protein
VRLERSPAAADVVRQRLEAQLHEDLAGQGGTQSRVHPHSVRKPRWCGGTGRGVVLRSCPRWGDCHCSARADNSTVPPPVPGDCHDRPLRPAC